jgi:hypothetical protein
LRTLGVSCQCPSPTCGSNRLSFRRIATDSPAIAATRRMAELSRDRQF